MNGKLDLVSIILPVYNGARFLRDSIESVLSQTYQNIEFIIVDDCSTDETPKIIKDYADRDKRIRYYRNNENLKLPRNLNKGFSLSKGEYLTWTSDDNMYKSTAIEDMVEALRKTKSDFVYASFDIMDAEGRIVGVHEADSENMKKIAGENTVGACFLYTRNVYQVIGEYNPELVLVEDFDYWQRIFSRFKVTRVEKSIYVYRYHEGQLTNTMRKDLFYNNKEVTITKNRKGFGKLSFRELYYYYKGLHECRFELKKKDPDRIKYNILRIIYKIDYEYPRRLRSVLYQIVKRVKEPRN